MTSLQRLLATALLLVAIAGLSACGGQSKDDFVSDANEICKDAGDELDSLERPQSVDDIPEFAEKAKDVTEETHDKLDDLDPPDDVADDWDRYLANIDEVAGSFDELKAAGEAGDEQAVQELAGSGELQRLQDESRELAEQVGVEECGEPGAGTEGSDPSDPA